MICVADEARLQMKLVEVNDPTLHTSSTNYHLGQRPPRKLLEYLLRLWAGRVVGREETQRFLGKVLLC
jgi:hypothetical protein